MPAHARELHDEVMNGVDSRRRGAFEEEFRSLRSEFEAAKRDFRIEQNDKVDIHAREEINEQLHDIQEALQT